MSREPRFDLCVIGGGSGGLSAAAGAVQMGARVALIERGRMGGECLNSGCVPSKALLAAGHAADAARRSERFGVFAGVPPIEGRRVRDHLRGVIAGIAPHDSVERFESLGVTVIQEHARFVGPAEVEVAGRRIQARRFVIATGSSPLVPGIPGLESVPFLTNETVFDLADIPPRLIVLGGGPVGVELAQAFRDLGSEVTVLEQASILARDDPELVAVLRDRLTARGLELLEGARIAAVRRGTGGLGQVAVEADLAGATRIVAGTHLLLAAGRSPTVDGLDLERAGIRYTARGISVDARLRTSNRRVFALGDVTGGPPFTHAAGYQAGIVLRNALFRLPAKVDYRALPRVTYCEPELAQVGLTEAEARTMHRDVRVVRAPFEENDRARAERSADGMVKVVATPGGRILGVGIVGPSAGELIQTWVLVMSQRLGMRVVASMVAPYPTLGEASKRAASDFYAPRLFGPGVRRLVRLLSRLG